MTVIRGINESLSFFFCVTIKIKRSDKTMNELKNDIEMELDFIAETGLTPGNTDRAHQLLCMLSEMSNIAYKDTKTAYYREMNTPKAASMAIDTTPAEKADAYDEYLERKREYRYNQTDDSKSRLISALENYMYTFYEKMETMLRDAECKEERDTINHYLTRLKAQWEG